MQLQGVVSISSKITDKLGNLFFIPKDSRAFKVKAIPNFFCV